MNDTVILLGIVSWIITLLLMVVVIRHAINQSKLTGYLATLIDEVRMLRRELARERQSVIDERV